MSYPSIVEVNTSVETAPTPSLLQAMGALISQGATTLSPGNYSLLTQASSLTPLLPPPLALSSLVWSSGTVVATLPASIPGLTTDDTFITTLAGNTPTAFNGTYLATVTGANTFTFTLVTNPGSAVTIGTYTPPNQGELQAMVNTFFGQGVSQAVSVLELGAGNETTGPSALLEWLEDYPGVFYSFLVPRLWDGSAGLNSLISAYSTPSSKLYFFVTTTTSSYTQYLSSPKCVLAEVEAPSLALTEFSLAADFQHTLSYAPSSANMMTPNAFSFLYGVTPYPSAGNNALLQTLLNANVNFVGNGAEGGLSNALIRNGTTLDGNDFAWWYAADWIQIQCDLVTANAVFNGSNNPINPLYYNQGGINTLQDLIVGTVQDAISFGLATGTVVSTALSGTAFQTNLNNGVYAGQNVVNAIPFATYTAQNPSNYGKGLYGGFTVVFIPQNGFKKIVFGVLVTNLLSQ